MSKGNWTTYVVVVDWGRKSWTMGPFHHRAQAEKAIEDLPTLDGLNAWVEPVHRAEDCLKEVREAVHAR